MVVFALNPECFMVEFNHWIRFRYCNGRHFVRVHRISSFVDYVGHRRDVFAVTRLTAILTAASCFVSSLINWNTWYSGRGQSPPIVLYAVGFRSCMQQQFHIVYLVIPFHTVFKVICINS